MRRQVGGRGHGAEESDLGGSGLEVAKGLRAGRAVKEVSFRRESRGAPAVAVQVGNQISFREMLRAHFHSLETALRGPGD